MVIGIEVFGVENVSKKGNIRCWGVQVLVIDSCSFRYIHSTSLHCRSTQNIGFKPLRKYHSLWDVNRFVRGTQTEDLHNPLRHCIQPWHCVSHNRCVTICHIMSQSLSPSSILYSYLFFLLANISTVTSSSFLSCITYVLIYFCCLFLSEVHRGLDIKSWRQIDTQKIFLSWTNMHWTDGRYAECTHCSQKSMFDYEGYSVIASPGILVYP